MHQNDWSNLNLDDENREEEEEESTNDFFHRLESMMKKNNQLPVQKDVNMLSNIQTLTDQSRFCYLFNFTALSSCSPLFSQYRFSVIISPIFCVRFPPNLFVLSSNYLLVSQICYCISE